MLKLERARLLKYLKVKHPKIVRLDSEIERGYKIAELYRTQTREQLASARQALNMKLESVQGAIKEWETKVVNYRSRIAEAESLKLKLTQSQGFYDRLDAMLRSVDIGRRIDQETLDIQNQASSATQSRKNQFAALGLSAMIGLGVGLALVFLIEIRDDRFTSLSEVTHKFGNSIIGMVPEVKALRASKKTALLQDVDNPHMLSESYRNLRSALLFLPLESERPQVLLISSPVPDEGKSTIAAHLARTFAQGGSRVLLIDADLRRGSLHHALGLKKEPGLADFLSGSAKLEGLVQTNCLTNLSFLSRGADLERPGDALLSPEWDRALARWRQDFDFVIIDSPPVFAADDASNLAPKADGTLIVVRRGFSRAGATREAIETLLQRQAKVLGLVFNRADASSGSYYYYKHKEYYGKKEDR